MAKTETLKSILKRASKHYTGVVGKWEVRIEDGRIASGYTKKELKECVKELHGY